MFFSSSISICSGKIEDGDKHPYNQLFKLMETLVKITRDTILEAYALEIS